MQKGQEKDIFVVTIVLIVIRGSFKADYAVRPLLIV